MILNVLEIICVLRKRNQTFGHGDMILSLAFADFLCGIALSATFKWQDAQHWLLKFSVLTSVTHLIVIASDRFMAAYLSFTVYKRNTTKIRVCIVLIIAWIIAISLLPFTQMIVIMLIVTVTTMILILMYVSVAVKIKLSKGGLLFRPLSKEPNTETTVLCSCITLSFVVCNMPFAFVLFRTYNYTATFWYILMFLNPSMDPIVYFANEYFWKWYSNRNEEQEERDSSVTLLYSKKKKAPMVLLPPDHEIERKETEKRQETQESLYGYVTSV